MKLFRGSRVNGSKNSLFSSSLNPILLQKSSTIVEPRSSNVNRLLAMSPAAGFPEATLHNLSCFRPALKGVDKNSFSKIYVTF